MPPGSASPVVEDGSQDARRPEIVGQLTPEGPSRVGIESEGDPRACLDDHPCAIVVGAPERADLDVAEDPRPPPGTVTDPRTEPAACAAMILVVGVGRRPVRGDAPFVGAPSGLHLAGESIISGHARHLSLGVAAELGDPNIGGHAHSEQQTSDTALTVREAAPSAGSE